uniref:Uncharacterized protein n=1 Tax=Oryza meridionalis TaxID=40149 RepID=A0A0E0CK17_9ORYZ
MASSRRYRKGSGPERDEKPELKVQTRGYKLAKAVIDSLSYHWDGHLGCCLPESSPCFRSNLP